MGSLLKSVLGSTSVKVHSLCWVYIRITMTSSALFSFKTSVLISAFFFLNVCGQQQDNVAVVEGIPVPSGDDGLSVAQDRIDLGDYQDDQIAEESQLTQVFAQDRDGGGHSHDHSHEHGPVAVAVPAPDGYDTPQAPPAPTPVEDGYGAPQAPLIDEYGAPQAPPQTQYNPCTSASASSGRLNCYPRWSKTSAAVCSTTSTEAQVQTTSPTPEETTSSTKA